MTTGREKPRGRAAAAFDFGRERAMSVATITVGELGERLRRGDPVDLIDVRTSMEFRTVHAQPARLVPLNTLDPETVMEGRDGSGEPPLYVICQTGGRSRKAVERFQGAGYANVVNVEGGTLAWEAAGLPVIRGEKAISLERQVRIAAGSLVLLGTILGAVVHPAWLGLSGFVGAGLIFAGVTDTCGMGMLLARMPWNRVGAEGPSCAR